VQLLPSFFFLFLSVDVALWMTCFTAQLSAAMTGLHGFGSSLSMQLVSASYHWLLVGVSCLPTTLLPPSSSAYPTLESLFFFHPVIPFS